MRYLSVSLVPNLGKTTQSPQSDLTPWILTLDETVEQLDSVRRENKNLADEIKDLLDQLGEGGRSIHELDKQRRRLQVSFFFLQKMIFSSGQMAGKAPSGGRTKVWLMKLKICWINLVKEADLFMNWTNSDVACK